MINFSQLFRFVVQSMQICLVLVMLIVLSMTVGISTVMAEITQLTSNNYNDYSPQISNGKITWYHGTGFNSSEIFLHDIATGTTTQINSNNFYNPDLRINDGKVVWTGSDGTDTEIFLYDIATATTIQITNNIYSDGGAQINDGKVVWASSDGIFLYDIATATTIQITNHGSTSPQVNDGRVVWSRYDDTDSEIFLYHIATGATTQITNDSYDDRSPQISDGRVVWSRYVGSHIEILIYDSATGTTSQITNNSSIDYIPPINDGKVVWTENDGTDNEIFLYDVTTGITTQITNNNYSDNSPWFSHEKVTWYQYKGTDPEIFLYYISSGVTLQITSNDYHDSSPIIDNEYVIWPGYVDNDAEIFLWDGIIPNNQEPFLTSVSDKIIDEGQILQFTITATDPDGNNLTYSANNLPEGATFDPQTATFSWTPNYSQEGTYTNIEFTVTDDGTPIESDTVAITITVNNTPPTTLTPIADSYIKQGSPNENEGSSTFMRVQLQGKNRALVRFDQSQIEEAVGNSQNFSAKLQLTISDNGNNWGTGGRTIGIHRLSSDWAEGNGFNDNNTPPVKGTGLGTTWKCATDSNINNTVDNCSGPTQWNMTNSIFWPFISTPTVTTAISNNQTGIVEFDVTTDIQEFINGSSEDYGWLIKKTDEGENGRIEFGSKESLNSPNLIITPN